MKKTIGWANARKTIIIGCLLAIAAVYLGACDSLSDGDPNSIGVGQVTELETVYIGVILPGAGEGAPEDAAAAGDEAADEADAADADTVTEESSDAATEQPATPQLEEGQSGSAAATSIDYEAARQARIAMELAVDIINSSHDIAWDIAENLGLADYGHARVELVFRDSGSSTESAAAAATELIELGVPLLIGAVDPQLTAAAAVPANLHGVPLICGSAQDATLTDGATYRFSSTFNRIAAPDTMETALFLDYLNQLNITTSAGINKIAVAYIDNDYGRHTAAVLSAALAKTNLQLVAQVAYPANQSDLSEEASRVIISEPDAIFQISGPDDLCSFADFYALSEFQPKAAFCYSAGFASSAFAALTEERDLDFYLGAMVCPDLFYQSDAPAATDEEAQLTPAATTDEEAPGEASAQDEDKAVGEEQLAELTPEEMRQQASEIFSYLNGLYRERAGVDMSSAALLEFAAVIVVAQAVDTAATCDIATLNALLKSTVFPVPYLYSGNIAFDSNGQNSVSPEYVAMLVDGRYTFVY
jgi:ABC-type branched-subunit amino acid transport system substrate-binding protein